MTPDQTPALFPQQKTKELEVAFLLYCTFCGDALRTAHALGVTVDAIQGVAKEQGWDKKIAGIMALSRSQKPGDLERAINRALNFVQAHQWRRRLQAVIDRFLTMDDERFIEVNVKPATKGHPVPEFSARSLADFTAALEKVHQMTYLALGDSGQERSKRAAGSDEPNCPTGQQSTMFSDMAKQMASMSAQDSPAAKLLGAQAERSASLVAPLVERLSEKPVNCDEAPVVDRIVDQTVNNSIAAPSGTQPGPQSTDSRPAGVSAQSADTMAKAFPTWPLG